jgi:SLOG cluster2
VIGGYVALSGYTDEEKVAKRITDAWLTIARKLWSEGATLAYGGAMGKKLTDALHADMKRVSYALTRTGKDQAPNPRLWQFEPADGLDEKELDGVHYEPQPAFTDTERAFIKERPADPDRKWVVEAIRRFRRRLDVSERSVARFAVCGKGAGYNGRFSGIAEEVMLTLALGKPVYVAGGFGGAAREVGALLGLARPWTGEKLAVFEPVLSGARLAMLEHFSEAMRPPGFEGLPLTQEALVSFLRDRCVDGTRWPNNGLDVGENRELFSSEDGDRIAELVLKGLTRRHATP